MQIEVKTRSRLDDEGRPELILTWTWMPRGSGNRHRVQAVAEHLRKHPDFAPHILRLVVGSTRLVIHFRASMKLAQIFWKMKPPAAIEDVPGQLPLPFGVGG